MNCDDAPIAVVLCGMTFQPRQVLVEFSFVRTIQRCCCCPPFQRKTTTMDRQGGRVPKGGLLPLPTRTNPPRFTDDYRSDEGTKPFAQQLDKSVPHLE